MIKNPFKKSDELVEDFLKDILGDEKGAFIKIKEDWKESVGEELAKRTEPEEFNKGILYVKVSGAIWRKELKMTAGRKVEEVLKSKFPMLKKVVWR
ncbi:DUF721 domain-containing protein [bacterium]|nr:DUF721 domain-containing protein [bacterium]